MRVSKPPLGRCGEVAQIPLGGFTTLWKETVLFPEGRTCRRAEAADQGSEFEQSSHSMSVGNANVEVESKLSVM